MFACLMTATLTACASSSGSQRLNVDLPASPQTYQFQPVTPPPITTGQSPKALAGAYIVALDTANGRIRNWQRWFTWLRDRYSTGTLNAGGEVGQ